MANVEMAIGVLLVALGGALVLHRLFGIKVLPKFIPQPARVHPILEIIAILVILFGGSHLIQKSQKVGSLAKKAPAKSCCAKTSTEQDHE